MRTHLEKLLNDVRDEIRLLHKEGDLGTHIAGRLLVAQGKARLAAHPREDERDWDDDPDAPWTDFFGNPWPLTSRYRDRNGNTWKYSGGFTMVPDAQPLLSRDDYSEVDVPLCYVQAAVGPMREVT